MAKGLRSKSRRKCNTQKRAKLKKFEDQRLDRIASKIALVSDTTFTQMDALPLSPPKPRKTTRVRVTNMDTDDDGKLQGITKQSKKKTSNRS